MCLLYFIAYIDRVNISVAGPLVRKEFNLSATELGFVFSAFAYPYAVMQIFGGWCADKFAPAHRADGAQRDLGDCNDPVRLRVGAGLADRIPLRARYRRRWCVSDRDPGFHVLVAGQGTWLRPGHHAQLCAARGCGDTTDRDRYRGALRLA